MVLSDFMLEVSRVLYTNTYVARYKNYRMEGNFRGVKISRIEAIKKIAGEIFADCTNINHTH